MKIDEYTKQKYVEEMEKINVNEVKGITDIKLNN